MCLLKKGKNKKLESPPHACMLTRLYIWEILRLQSTVIDITILNLHNKDEEPLSISVQV